MIAKKIILAGLLAGLMLAGTVFAGTVSTGGASEIKGYSMEELEALIIKLQAQLAEMKKGAQCFVTESDLSLGDGEDDESRAKVARLQDFLREKGHFNRKSTGYFGKITRAALAAFQADNALSQTGEFDVATREKLKGMQCKLIKKGTVLEKVMVDKAEKAVKKERQMENKPASKINSVSLYGDGNKIKWVADGYSANGFKVVWSKNPGPTYPTRDGDKYQYFSDSSVNSTALEAFSEAGKYYVRACEYLGGSCGVYSNEIELQL